MTTAPRTTVPQRELSIFAIDAANPLAPPPSYALNHSVSYACVDGQAILISVTSATHVDAYRKAVLAHDPFDAAGPLPPLPPGATAVPIGPLSSPDAALGVQSGIVRPFTASSDVTVSSSSASSGAAVAHPRGLQPLSAAHMAQHGSSSGRAAAAALAYSGGPTPASTLASPERAASQATAGWANESSLSSIGAGPAPPCGRYATASACGVHHMVVALTAAATICASVEPVLAPAAAKVNLPRLPIDAVAAHAGDQLEAAADATPAADTSDEDWTVQRERQREFVRGIKDMLRTNMMRDSAAYLQAARTLEHLPTIEAERRVKHATAELDEAEALLRRGVASQEAGERAGIAAVRKAASLVPWCTQGCNACCMRRQHWEAHARDTAVQQVAFLESCEALGRRALVEAEAQMRQTFTALHWTHGTRHAALQAKDRDAAEEQERLARLAVELEAERAWAYTVEFPLEATRLKAANQEAAHRLRERSVEVLRVKDTLDLRERRAHRKDLLLCVEQEVTGRRGISTLEEVVFHQIMNRFQEYFSAEQLARNAVEIAELKAQREELLEYQRERQSEDAERANEAQRREQRELEEEYREIKRLKKAKGNPPPPQCPRCDAQPQNMHQHRLDECPGRPVMCAKCELVMPQRDNEEHKAQCPARIVQCPQCANWYQARYLEERHGDVCLNAKEARRMLAELKPRWPFTIVGPRPDGLELPPPQPQQQHGSPAGPLAASASQVQGAPGDSVGDSKPPLGAGSPTGTAEEAAQPPPLGGAGVVIQFDDPAAASADGVSAAGSPRVSSLSAVGLMLATREFLLTRLDDQDVDAPEQLTELLSTLAIGERCVATLRVMPPPPGAAASSASPGAPSLEPLEKSAANTPARPGTTQSERSAFGDLPMARAASSIGSSRGTPGQASLAPPLTAPGAVLQRDVKVATSVPLQEYRSLALLTADDDQYVKPAPAQGKKKKA